MADQFPTTSPTSAQTTSPEVVKGKLVPRKAIGSASQAQGVADGLVQDDIGRDSRRAELQRALNGNEPYSPKALREKGQAHRFNVSVGYLEGACGRAYSPYLDMGLDEEFVARIDAPDLDESKKNILRDEFVRSVRKWGQWSRNYNGLVRETVDFGYCTAVFLDPESPWWQPARQREGLTFARAPNIASKLDVYVLRRNYLIHELYDHVSDVEIAKAAGWDVENVWQALENAAPDDYLSNSRVTGGRQVYEEAIRAAAIAVSFGRGAKVIRCYHVFCRELSGKVSQYITLDSSGTKNSTDSPLPSGAQLFYQFEQFESMDEVVVRFDFEYGDGYWHGAKGLAQKLYGVHKAHDRLICAGLDQTFRGGLGVLKSTSQKAHEAINLQVTSDFVVLSPDYEATPGVKMPTLDQNFFSMDAALLATAVQRGGDVAPEAMGIERSQKTATQASIDQGQKQVITKSNMKRWVPPLSNIIDKMFRRLIKVTVSEATGELIGHPDAVAFVTSVLEKGLTMEDIAKVRKLEVFHSIEDVFGETKNNISFIADKYRQDPDADRIALKKMEVGVWLGPAKSLELIPGDADELSRLRASREQTLEISAILDGNAIPVDPADIHSEHVKTVCAYIKATADNLASGNTGGKRIPSAQDIMNLQAHAEQHVQAEGSVKGNRESARALQQMIEQALMELKQGMEINQKKHIAAQQHGLALGLSQPPGTTPPAAMAPPTGGAAPSPTAAPAPQPETMAA